MKSTAKWVKNYQSVVDNGRGHAIVIDLPPDEQGDDYGATALELTVMGLSGCISTIFAVVAHNSKVSFQDLHVELDAQKPDGEKTITTAKAIVTVWSDAEETRIRRVLDKTMRTCPVGVLFEQAGVNVEHELIVEKPA